MRRFIALVPLVLVAGYAVAAGSQRHRAHDVVVSVAQSARDHGSHQIRVSEAVAVAQEAEAIAARAEALAAVAEVRAARVESVSALASAQASITITLEGLVETIRQELERSAESGEPIELQNLQVSAELLAQIAAEFEGVLEIQGSDSNRVVVGSTDGAHVEFTIQ